LADSTAEQQSIILAGGVQIDAAAMRSLLEHALPAKLRALVI